ncbi:Hypothetical protein PHPALM_13827 [Phytophthora palmivora]|uniref:MULE transposase domain-containing protein n=1 Tax=Phytophthora palmivora TaxID=4796 RepID=A0A2P4XWB9_9STRA|nr:Hypothetical protein PHPALM_13827 [Phytophthora palmivora]
MAPYSRPNPRCRPLSERQRLRLKSDDEFCGILICLVALKRLQSTKAQDPVVRQRLSWKKHATTLLKEKAFKHYYRIDLPTFEALLGVVAPYLVIDYYQSLWRTRGAPPPSPAVMLQCALKLMRSLPTCATAKHDLSKCTMDHASMDQYELPHTTHKMRSILTKCTSARCALREVKCGCRYKLPKKERIVWKVAGPPPLESQVQGYMKRWRAKNRDDSMELVIGICAQPMFELVPNVDQSGGNLLVFCDSTWHNNKLIPNIGNTSDSSPFRMELTSYTLLEQYVTIQQDPRCVTILHVDSTHSMVRQRYNVFILGVSDSCGRFFHVVYYCASQRRAEDVAWCFNYLKRVMLRVFAVNFAPHYIMTDADKAQYSVCATEIPSAKILMCWFHVCQHAWEKSKKLSKLKRDLIFRGLNDLHFCRNQNEFEIRKVNIINEWITIGQTCQRFQIVSKKRIRQWFDNPRFSNWQSFHTPPGYSNTNNPVKQYHRTLKLGNSSHATPFEMINLLDRSRRAFQANI